MTQPSRADFEFRMGDVFPPCDSTARYVARLSMGLADLRLVADQLMRDGLSDRERVYFSRLMMAHMREVVLVLEPPDSETDALRVTDVIATMGTTDPRAPAYLARLWEAARDQLKAPLELQPKTTVWRELRRVRNRLLHYGYTQEADRALGTALETVADEQGVYRLVAEGFLSADFADLISINLAFPMSAQTRALPKGEQRAREEAEAEEILQAVLDVMQPLATLLQMIESVFFRMRPDQVTVRFEDGSSALLSSSLDRHVAGDELR